MCLSTAVVAQDPAHGWMAYAVGTIPASAERMNTTHDISQVYNIA